MLLPPHRPACHVQVQPEHALLLLCNLQSRLLPHSLVQTPGTYLVCNGYLWIASMDVCVVPSTRRWSLL